MEFTHLKHRMRYINKFGKRSILVGAAVLCGVSVGCKLDTDKLKAGFCPKVYATTRPTTTSSDVKFASWDANWDRRHFAFPHTAYLSNVKVDNLAGEKEPQPKAKRHLLLIRHGQYNEDADTDNERILTEIGQFQAKMTAQRLLELNLPYTRLVASTMTRARQTAQIIRTDMKANFLDLEMDSTLVEGAPVVPSPPTSNWKPQASQFFQDGARIESAFRKYFHRADSQQQQDSYELVVCHSNVIRYFVCRALQFPLSGWIRFSIANCSMTMITIHPDGLVMVEMLGDHGHIPAEGVTYH